MLRTLPLEQLSRAPWNPRRREGDLTDLFASISAKGVLLPLIVRPNGLGPSAQPMYEIVCGGRRYVAAIQAGLAEVPCLVREDLDDAAALEVAIVENAQREDVMPLEEGEAYKRLRDECGLTVEQIVDRVGKNRAHVYSRLKLTEVAPPVREAIEKGELTPSAALPIARLEPERQERALKELRRYAAPFGSKHFEPATARDAEMIADRIRHEPTKEERKAEQAKYQKELAKARETDKKRRAEWAKQDEQRKRTAERREAVIGAALPRLVEKAEAADFTAAVWRALVRGLDSYGGSFDLVKRRELAGRPGGDRAAFERLVDAADFGTLRGIAVELLAATEVNPYSPTYGGEFLELCRAYRIDLKPLERKAEADQRAKLKAAAAAAPAKGKKKKGRAA
jgi:ParB/RepB/Spo0J family partition protein